MARTFLTIMAAAATAAVLCLACADPTPSSTATALSEAPLTADLTPTTTEGPKTFNLDNITGTWWAYVREGGDDGPFSTIAMNISRKTPYEIAVYEHLWFNRSASQKVKYRPDPSIAHKAYYYCEFKYEGINDTNEFLIEVTDPIHMRTLNRDGRMEFLKIKFANGGFIFREDSGPRKEYNFFRTLPKLETYARCEYFDRFDASEAFDDDSLVGTWTTMRLIRGFFYNLRVTRKTAEEISAYREDLRTTTVQEADIDWTKVRLHAELFSTRDYFRAFGLIEELDKPGSIRVIPVKDTWDIFVRMAVENWFSSQNLFIKKVDELLAVSNCGSPLQKGYFSIRPQIRTRKMW